MEALLGLNRPTSSPNSFKTPPKTTHIYISQTPSEDGNDSLLMNESVSKITSRRIRPVCSSTPKKRYGSTHHIQPPQNQSLNQHLLPNHRTLRKKYNKKDIQFEEELLLRTIFRDYDKILFERTMHRNRVQVQWSNRLKCNFGSILSKPEHDAWIINISRPLLKLRPIHSFEVDLRSTLLHVMIHAYLFFKGKEDNGKHGDIFRSLMERINRIAGTNVTIHHNWHEEMARCKELRFCGTKQIPK